MAEIDIERAPSRAWIWWLLGAVVLVLLLWMFAARSGDDVDDVGIAAVPQLTELPVPVDPAAEAAGPGALVVSEILQAPMTWAGRTLAGEVQVGEVSTDRGFWITEQGERLFVILGDGPEEQPKDINPDQRLRLSEVMVYRSDQVDSIPGQLDADTRRIIESQPVVLYVDERNVTILSQL